MPGDELYVGKDIIFVSTLSVLLRRVQSLPHWWAERGMIPEYKCLYVYVYVCIYMQYIYVHLSTEDDIQAHAYTLLKAGRGTD